MQVVSKQGMKYMTSRTERVDFASNLRRQPSLPMKRRDSDVNDDREVMKSFNATLQEVLEIKMVCEVLMQQRY